MAQVTTKRNHVDSEDILLATITTLNSINTAQYILVKPQSTLHLFKIYTHKTDYLLQ